MMLILVSIEIVNIFILKVPYLWFNYHLVCVYICILIVPSLIFARNFSWFLAVHFYISFAYSLVLSSNNCYFTFIEKWRYTWYIVRALGK